MALTAEQREYLGRVLESDPLHAAPAILHWRARLRGEATEVPGATDGVRRGVERDALEMLLRQTHDSFFESDPDDVLGTLEALDCDAHPDLADWRDRMIDVVELHDVFERARGDSKVDRKVLRALSQIAIAPEEQAVVSRRQSLHVAGDAVMAKSARRLERHYPEVAELEAAWLGRLKSRKKDRKLAMTRKTSVAAFLLGWFFLRLLIHLFKVAG